MMNLNDKSTENTKNNLSSVSGFDEYSASEQQRMTQINKYGGTNMSEGSFFRPSVHNRGGADPNEFARCTIARCTISSSSTNRDSNSECESVDQRESLRSRSAYIKTAHFRGTGQNGQILKEDLPTWSRKLHNKQH